MTALPPPPFGAIFDWDGVIIDSARLHEQSWYRTAADLGPTIAPHSFLTALGMARARTHAATPH